MRLRQRRTDANQAEIVKALRQIGCSVVSLHRVGEGCPDLLVGKLGRNYLLEVKSDKGELTEAETAFMESWRGWYLIVRNRQEAIAAVSEKG